MKDSFFLLSGVFLLTQLSAFAESVPKVGYLMAIVLAIYVFVCCKVGVSKMGKEYTIKILSILLIGACISLLFINNGNILLCFPFSLNCLVYLSIADNKHLYISYNSLIKFFKLVTYWGVIACIYNIVINRGGMGSLSVTSNAYMVDFASFYSGRNTFGSLLFFFIVTSFFVYLKTSEKKYIFCIFLMLVNLVFTFSRTSIITISLFFFFILLFHYTKHLSKFLCIAAVLCLFFFLGLGFVNDNYDLIDHFLIREGSGETVRYDYWDLSINYIINNPIFGYGPGSGSFILEDNSSHLTEVTSSFHNTLIEITVWGGICLLIVYILLFRYIFLYIRKIKKFDIVFYRVYMAFFLSYLIYSMYETLMFFAVEIRANLISLLLIVLPPLYYRCYTRKEICMK